jgi:glycosyltransferase involved in cell wall biosynthesis
MPGRVFGFFARIASSLPVKNVPHIQHALSLSTRHARLVKQLNSARRIFPPTRQTFEVLAAAGIHPDLLAYQPYGLNLEHIKRHPRPALKSSGLHVGFIGTLSPHKGAHVLLEAVKSVSPDVHLSIWGKETDFPEYVSTLKAMAGTQPTIAFRGTFDNDTFSDVLATLDCVVVPSLWRENAPLVMLSSLAAGCPVLASDYPGLAEHVKNGENGFLFIPGDAASLASLIQRLRDDKELLARLSNGSTPPPSIHEYVDFLISSIFK